MNVRDEFGIPWHGPAFESAQRHGVQRDVSALALRYLSGHSTTTYPDPRGRGRIRVVQGGLAAVLAPDGVVIGFDARLDTPAGDRPDPRPQGRRKGVKRPSGGRSGQTGPTTMRELIAMAEAEGAVVETNGHFSVRFDGRRTNIASTPRSEAGVRNATARLRRELGLRLRRK